LTKEQSKQTSNYVLFIHWAEKMVKQKFPLTTFPTLNSRHALLTQEIL